MLPASVTGSWPRPRWYDQGLWGRPLDFLPRTLMNEIETTWRWPRVVGKVEHDPKDPARVRQAVADVAGARRIRQAGEVRHVLVAGASPWT